MYAENFQLPEEYFDVRLILLLLENGLGGNKLATTDLNHFELERNMTEIHYI